MDKPIHKKAMVGVFWNFSDLVFSQGFNFFMQVILARILSPEDFGIIGILTLIISLASIIIDGGFANALIRKREVSQGEYSTIFFVNLTVSMILYCLLFLIAPLIADFFQNGEIVNWLRAIGTVLLINIFGFIQRILLIRKIEFQIQTKINLFSSIVSGVIAIVGALYGMGVWALIFRNVLMQGLQSLLLCVCCKWRPSFEFDGNAFSNLFQFGWKILLSNLINIVFQNFYYIFIGKIYSISELGYFTQASKLCDTASQLLPTAIQKVTYPILSNLKNEENKLKEGYKRIVCGTMFVCVPIMVFLFITAEPIILLLLGEKWRNSILYFQILCFDGILIPLHLMNLNILQVCGRSDLVLLLEIIKKSLFMFLILLVISYEGNLVALLISGNFFSCLSYIMNSHFSFQMIHYSTCEQIEDISRILFSSFVMGVCGYGTIIVFQGSPIEEITLKLVVCIGSYLLCSKLMKIREVKYIVNLYKRGV